MGVCTNLAVGAYAPMAFLFSSKDMCFGHGME